MNSTAIVVSVLNEEGSIDSLLDSLRRQSRTPGAIVVVDGGSSDRTAERIETAAPGVRLLRAPGANRARARNLGVEAASARFTAVTDAGCEPARDWFERLIGVLESTPGLGAVGGLSRVRAQSRLERAVGAVLVPAPWEIDPGSWLPSSRNLAFTRDAFDRAGGYPEKYDYNEDTVFALNLRRVGVGIGFEPGAVVRWSPPSTLEAALRTFYNYGRGDGQAGTCPGLYGRIGLKYGALAAALSATGFRGPGSAAALGLLLVERPAFFGRVAERPGLDLWTAFPVKWLRDATLMAGWLRGRTERPRFWPGKKMQ